LIVGNGQINTNTQNQESHAKAADRSSHTARVDATSYATSLGLPDLS
jgi:hypothetical protein